MRQFLRYFILVFIVFFSFQAYAQTSKSGTEYIVKKHDTIYGLALHFHITEAELREANPKMKVPGYVLKADEKIIIPKHGQKIVAEEVNTNTVTKTETTPVIENKTVVQTTSEPKAEVNQKEETKTEPKAEVKKKAETKSEVKTEKKVESKKENKAEKKSSTVTETKSTTKTGTIVGSSRPGQTVRVGVMLPLHDNDGDGRRMVEYYRGILMACDSLRSRGINTDIHAWNVDIDADIRTTLLEDAAQNLDIVFGPLYAKQVNSLAQFCLTNGIKLVIPFSTTATDVQTNPAIYQVYQTPNELNSRAVGAYLGQFKDCHTVVVECNDTTYARTNFTHSLRKQLESLGMSYKIANLTASASEFSKAFSRTKRNVVVLNSASSPKLNLTFRQLNELVANNPSINISMFGFADWFQYESTYRPLFHKYDVYIPTTYYYYKGLTRIAGLEENYTKWFGTEMQERYIPRFAITGYDQAQFFIRGLYEKGGAFNATRQESTYIPAQTPLRFVRVADNGGMQNHAFMLVHYNNDLVIETIEY